MGCRGFGRRQEIKQRWRQNRLEIPDIISVCQKLNLNQLYKRFSRQALHFFYQIEVKLSYPLLYYYAFAQKKGFFFNAWLKKYQ